MFTENTEHAPFLTVSKWNYLFNLLLNEKIVFVDW